MANDIFGGELNIQGLEDGIDRIEKKMTNLSRNFTTNSNKIINAFRDINANGVQQLVNKLGELQTALTNISSKNANLGNVGSGASKSVDEITKLTDALVKLKAINSLKLKTDKAKRDYLKEANDIKEVVIQEKERTRELERQNKLNIELNNKRLTVDKKGESNLIRQEMNAQRQKERALIEADAKDKARHKDRMVRLRQQLDEINRLAKAYKAMPTNISTKSVGGLIGQSVNATSINQRITAINNMKNALRDLDTTTEKGKRTEEYLTSEIKRQTKELKKQGVNLDEVKKRKHSLMNTTDQLQRKLVLLFSVSAIQGYVSKLVKVRGEFEMQNKALQVLLQNKDEANKLWDQTVKLAVKSPFTVKELVTYTKQLAAYRIESDKLHETNKMLADVSAGLGVDMQRLILAYGQVKAANFLRGTELRQFSEAGVNMLGELAKMYSEIEGKTISVGEVFERVSKRMVSFGDVEEVFKRITSAGGAFYNMQEEQSKTLQGMWRNLGDSIDLMMNDIGQAYDGTMKSMINATRTLVENWRYIAPLIKTIGMLLTINIVKKGVMAIVAYGSTMLKPFKMLAFELAVAWKNAHGLKATLTGFSATSWGAIIAILGALGMALWEAYDYSSKLNEELSRINLDLSKRLDEGIEKYRELADQVANVTNSENERNKALNELKRIFGDILPDEMLRKETIASYAGNYEKAEKAMRSYYEAEWSKQSENKIRDSYSEDLDDSLGFVKAGLKKSLDFTQNPEFAYNISDEMIKRIKDRYMRVLNSVRKDAETGKISTVADDLAQTFISRLSKSAGVDEITIKQIFNAHDLRNILTEYSNEVTEMVQEINDVQPLTFDSWNEEVAAKKAKAIEEQVEVVQNAYSKIANLAQQKAQGKVYWGDILPDIKAILTDAKIAAPEYYEVLDRFWNKLKNSAYKGSFEFNNALNDISDGFNDSVAQIAKTVGKGNTVVDNFAENLEKKLDGKKLTPQLQSIIDVFRAAATKFSIPMSVFDNIKFGLDTSLTETRNSVKDRLDEIKKTIAEFEKALSSMNSIAYDPKFTVEDRVSAIEKRFGMTKEDVAELKKQIPALTLVFEMLGGVFKPTGGRGRKSDPAKELAKVMQDMFREYEKMNDKFSDKTSKKDVATYFKQTFEEVAKQVKGFNLALDNFDFTTFDGLINALTTLKDFAKDEKTGREIGQIISNLQTEKETTKIDKTIEAREREVELLYEQYDLYKDLKKQGVSTALAKNLFNINVTNIDELAKGINEIFTEKHGPDTEWGEDIVKAYQDAMDKIAKMGKDARVEQLKQYVKLERDGFSERIKAYLESYDKQKDIDETFAPSTEMLVKFNIDESELNNIQKLFQGYLKGNNVDFSALTISDDQVKELKEYFEYLKEGKEYAQNGINKVLQESLVDIEVKEFKDSALYDVVFGDFEKLSEASITIVREKLNDLQTQLKNAGVVDDAKLQELLNKLNDAERKAAGVWATYKEDKKAVEGTYNDDLYKGYKANNGKETGINAWIAIQAKAMKEIAEQSQIIALYEKIRKDNGGKLNDIEQNELNNAIKLKGQAESNLQTSNESIEKHKKLTDSQKNLIKSGQAWGDALMNVLGNADQLADALGQSEDSSARMVIKMLQGFISIGMQILSLIVSLEAMGLALNSALGIIGLIGIALSAIVMAVSIFASSADDTEKINAEIERQQQLVDRLNREYDRLQKNLDKMSTFAGFQKMSESIENLRKQQRAYERMIDLEYSKKDSDASKIQEYIGNITDIAEKIADVYEDLRNTLIDDFKDISEELADAMLSALKEGEDAISAWGESVDEIVQNLVKKIVVAKLIEPEVEKLIDEYYNSLMPRTSKAEEWAKAETEATAIWEKYAKAYANIPSDKDAGSWSDLIGADLYNIMAKLDKQKNVTFDEFYEAVKDFLPQFTKDQIRSIFKQRAWDEYGNWSIHLGDTLVALLSLMTQTAKAEMDNAKKKQDEAERAAEGEEVTFNQEASDKLSEELEKLGTDVFDQLPDYVKAMFEESASSLTGLQKGIQGITESTAQVLEGYLNSIRFYVAQDNGNLNRIVEMLTTYTTTNPILSELKAQTEVVRSIRDMFAGVIRSGHPTFGGSFIKVAL